MVKQSSRLQRIREGARALLAEHAPGAEGPRARLHRWVHFWVLVGRSFSRNRCPVRASALAYATLLALIPMLAVAMSITSTFLKSEGEDRIDQFIVRLVASLTPPATLPEGANPPPAMAELPGRPATESLTNPVSTAATGEGTATNAPSLQAFTQAEESVKARHAVAREIHGFIQNTRSGALGLTGSVLLIFAGISLLTRIESTFNDIFGVARGRNWFTQVVLYWGVLTLAPLLLVVGFGLATGPHLEGPRALLTRMPFAAALLFRVLPAVLLCLTFGLIYLLMPNTRVHWRAAFVGGLVGGLLMHLNNAFSVLYVSRVVSNSKIYGSLGLIPVFMIGLYFAWLILLFGAQVAYAYQNRAAYFEEKQVESVNQRGREFIALRLMTRLGQHFDRGQPPPTLVELSEDLNVPTRLAQQVLSTLGNARLVVETVQPQGDQGFMPARPLEQITCHDILLALRASQGQELATRDEPTRLEVYGEFQRILEAERRAAETVTLQALVQRAMPPQLEAPVGPAAAALS